MDKMYSVTIQNQCDNTTAETIFDMSLQIGAENAIQS